MYTLVQEVIYSIKLFNIFIALRFIPRSRRQLAWRIYIYFRWIDDILDDSKISISLKKKFLNTQHLFLNNLYNNKESKRMTYEELGMVYVIQKMMADKEFKKRLLDLMSTFEFDLSRFGNKRVHYDELISYSKKIGESFAYIFFYCLCGKKYSRLLSLGHFAHLVHLFRDNIEDLKKGYNNLPLEFRDYNQFGEFLAKKNNHLNPRMIMHLLKTIDNPTLKFCAKCFYLKFFLSSKSLNSRSLYKIKNYGYIDAFLFIFFDRI